MTPRELIELQHAQEFPAWTMLKVRDPAVGWRSLSAHEICVLSEVFEGSDSEYQEVAKALGLVRGEDDE